MIPELYYKNCDICRNNNTELLFESKDRQFNLPGRFDVVRCRKCGLVYLPLAPSKSEISLYYPSNYGPHQAPIVDITNSPRMRIWRKYIKLFGGDAFSEVFSLENMPKGKVLDIGCGKGEYLKELQIKNWETYGIDISPSAAKECKKYGLKIFVGELIEATFPDGHFDAITMRHSIEHMHQPSEVLMEIHRILKDNGILLIEVPNINSIEAKIFKEHWYQIDCPRHIYHFSPKTIKLLLNNNGFRMLQITHDPSPKQLVGSIDYLLGKRMNKFFNYELIRSISQSLLYPLTSLIARYGYGTSFVVIAKKNNMGELNEVQLVKSC